MNNNKHNVSCSCKINSYNFFDKKYENFHLYILIKIDSLQIINLYNQYNKSENILC